MAHTQGSDDAYNARRRYGRQAERYIKKAAESSGETASRYKALARDAFDNAMRTYTDKGQKISARLQRVYEALNFSARSIEEIRPLYMSGVGENERKALVEQSKDYLVGDDQTRREREARILLSSTNVGHKIMGGLVDVWINADDRVKAILDYFGVDNLASVIDILEAKIGDALYSSDDIGATYAIVALQIQNAVVDNTLIQ